MNNRYKKKVRAQMTAQADQTDAALKDAKLKTGKLFAAEGKLAEWATVAELFDASIKLHGVYSDLVLADMECGWAEHACAQLDPKGELMHLVGPNGIGALGHVAEIRGGIVEMMSTIIKYSEDEVESE